MRARTTGVRVRLVRLVDTRRHLCAGAGHWRVSRARGRCGGRAGIEKQLINLMGANYSNEETRETFFDGKE